MEEEEDLCQAVLLWKAGCTVVPYYLHVLYRNKFVSVILKKTTFESTGEWTFTSKNSVSTVDTHVMHSWRCPDCVAKQQSCIGVERLIVKSAHVTGYDFTLKFDHFVSRSQPREVQQSVQEQDVLCWGKYINTNRSNGANCGNALQNSRY